MPRWYQGYFLRIPRLPVGICAERTAQRPGGNASPGPLERVVARRYPFPMATRSHDRKPLFKSTHHSGQSVHHPHALY
jgi:hypothetical protein